MEKTKYELLLIKGDRMQAEHRFKQHQEQAWELAGEIKVYSTGHHEADGLAIPIKRALKKQGLMDFHIGKVSSNRKRKKPNLLERIGNYVFFDAPSWVQLLIQIGLSLTVWVIWMLNK